MNDPRNNPTTNREKAGRRSRYFAGRAVAIKNFRADAATARAILFIQNWLQGKESDGDVISVSLLARRAIALYREHVEVCILRRTLAAERALVRQGSVLPQRRVLAATPRKQGRKPLFKTLA